LGFRKTAEVQGAFPCDPYSHTPGHRGAQQPGMTGAVKEEVLARWAELGIRVAGGRLCFAPALLHVTEFAAAPYRFEFVDVLGRSQTWDLPAGTLALTYCATPIAYELSDESSITIERADGAADRIVGAALPPEMSRAIFARDGSIARLTVRIARPSPTLG
jgi:hypothetical protein